MHIKRTRAATASTLLPSAGRSVVVAATGDLSPAELAEWVQAALDRHHVFRAGHATKTNGRLVPAGKVAVVRK